MQARRSDVLRAVGELVLTGGRVGIGQRRRERERARTDAAGLLVPLQEQNTQAWDGALIDNAAAHLMRAAALHCTGPYQLEAAIQMAHASRRHGGTTPWGDIQQLYEGLLARYPSLGAAVGHALSTASASGDALPGLQLLQAVDAARREHHLPWWAAQAHLLERAGRREEALLAYDQALRLARSSMLRRTLAARRDVLRGPLQ